ncbi:hypothetical protein LEP3755_51970 [Leptolyngbya sp. NIES-3755]|nr:hypothetical protein LEP3755_51970 [Leptolyngbya sp. NIES-3755]
MSHLKTPVQTDIWLPATWEEFVQASDKGDKRLLYETLGVREYWIVNVQKMSVLAFAIANQGSYKITQSQVLAGLEISVLEEAFRLSREMNHGKVSTWLLKQFQSS